MRRRQVRTGASMSPRRRGARVGAPAEPAHGPRSASLASRRREAGPRARPAMVRHCAAALCAACGRGRRPTRCADDHPRADLGAFTSTSYRKDTPTSTCACMHTGTGASLLRRNIVFRHFGLSAHPGNAVDRWPAQLSLATHSPRRDARSIHVCALWHSCRSHRASLAHACDGDELPKLQNGSRRLARHCSRPCAPRYREFPVTVSAERWSSFSARYWPRTPE